MRILEDWSARPAIVLLGERLIMSGEFEVGGALVERLSLVRIQHHFDVPVLPMMAHRSVFRKKLDR